MNYEKLWQIFGAKIVTIGNAPNPAEPAQRGLFFRFLQSGFPMWGKRFVMRPKKDLRWSGKRLRITIIRFHNTGCGELSRIVQKVTNGYNFW